ncbi:MAG: hypothetical protein P1Q69_15415 [Candidatus Thorarchaeota archaeon]|nr:hypothetical protein [Candidatus Thorarchaeota archaeon]
MSEVTDLERSILSVIIRDSHRASAITKILLGRHIKCDQNEVVQTLNSLEKRNLVERFTAKSWIAKGKAEDYVK